MRKLLKNMRLSVEDNSSPYGFSVMITGSFALLNTIRQPSVLDIACGTAGAVIAFMVAELAALAFLGSGGSDEDSQRTKLLGRLMGALSIGSGMTVAYLFGRYVGGPWGWLAAGGGATLTYLVLDGLELAVAEARKSE